MASLSPSRSDEYKPVRPNPEDTEKAIFGDSEDESDLAENFGSSDEDSDPNATIEPPPAPADSKELDDLDDAEYQIKKAPLPKFKKRDPSELPKTEKAARRRSKSQKTRHHDENEKEEEERDPSNPSSIRARVDREVEEILSKSKSKRAKKDDDSEDTAKDELAVKLVDQMRDTAFQDVEFNSKRQPAIAKLKLLPTVKAFLARSHYISDLSDNGLLSSMKYWLEPLPDGSLPSLDIQRTLLVFLETHDFDRGSLVSSGIGKIVLFYTKCSRVIPELQRVANRIVDKWMRLIIGCTNDYRDIAKTSVPYDAKAHSYYERVEVEAGDGPKGSTSTAITNRARIPMPITPNFEFVPESKLGAPSEKSKAPDRMKRILNRVMNSKRQGKTPGSKLSIEGRKM
ncbi:uncharacterized protein BJ171DRAFT_205534 [Polychytrium aggregatum]|uniref:uncharacterized protein n=1 Tax=Polychytrium aggregatum TaxID=110093 RepID=UPI0022FE207B|nr:uncharacterized protein BJ171DRAFT_205534 [Polychytrium aggregatum]KAI9199646.1 hypothetical protein BJ171DRAFT_205534 [Polychytrium aggregatum]